MKRSVLRMGMLAAALLAAVSLAGGPVQAAEPFRFLMMERHVVKWGPPALSTGAEVSYAFVDRPTAIEGARNCGEMQPLDALAHAARLPRDAVRREVEEALATWEGAAGIDFRRTDDPTEADIVIGAQATPRGIAFANVAYALPPAGARPIAKLNQALVCFNPTIAWSIGFDGNLNTFDIGFSALHEIGHAIGLDHPSPTGNVMSFKYLENYEALQAGDIAGARMLYGPPRAAAMARARPDAGGEAN